MVLNLCEQDYIQFASYADYYMNGTPSPEDFYRKTIHIPTYSGNCLMVLNYLELGKLCKMLELAQAAQATSQLLTELDIKKENKPGF